MRPVQEAGQAYLLLLALSLLSTTYWVRLLVLVSCVAHTLPFSPDITSAAPLLSEWLCIYQSSVKAFEIVLQHLWFQVKKTAVPISV